MAVKPTDKILGFEEQIAVSLGHISPQDYKEKSDLDDEEILHLSTIYLWAEITGVKSLKTFADNFLKLRVSRFRLGRREVVALGSSQSEPERRKLKSIKDLFAGIR
jgi:hypothetical protein